MYTIASHSFLHSPIAFSRNGSCHLPFRHSISATSIPRRLLLSLYIINIFLYSHNGVRHQCIRITFSMHSVVSCLSPFTVSQSPQPPITLDNGFSHRLRYNKVRNKINEVMNTKRNSLRKKEDVLKAVNHVRIAAFQPLPALVG